MLSDGAELACRISWEPLPSHGSYRMTAAMAGYPPVEVEAGDLFEALRQIRRALEDSDIVLCCAGARRDVWASGMQRDMGGGKHAYILQQPRGSERPPSVNIFDPAPREAVASVAEQEAFMRVWLDSPRG